MRKFIIGAVTATLLGSSLAGLAMAKEPGEYRQDRMAQELNLSAEQQTKMKELWSAHREDRVERRDAMREQMQQMRALDPKADNFNAEVDKLVNQAQERVAERIRAQAQMKAQMAEILTPEQMSKMQSLAPRHGDRFDDRRPGPDDRPMKRGDGWERGDCRR